MLIRQAVRLGRDTITTPPLLLRGTGVAMAASSQSKTVLPGWGEGCNARSTLGDREV